MNTDNMKNIIIIKNLPSNLVEEAIVVVKNKKKLLDVDVSNYKNEKNSKKNIIKGYMKSEDFEKIEKIQKENRSYVVKEAEMVVNDYLTKIEDNKNYKSHKKMEESYTKIRYINFVLIAISILSTIICIVK